MPLRHEHKHTQDDPQDPGRAIVPYGQDSEPSAQPPARDPFWVALTWCGLGAVALAGFSFIGVAMVAFGAATAFAGSLGKDRVALAAGASCVGACVGAWFMGGTPITFVELGLNLALAWVMGALVWRKRANVSSDYLVAAVLTLLYLALEAWGAYGMGTTLPALALSMTEGAVSLMSEGVGLDVAAQYRQLVPLIQLLWPFAFFVLAGGNVLAGHAGARLATLRQNPPRWNLVLFEAPTWSVVVLILGIVCAVFGPALQGASWGVQALGVTAVAAVRFVFMTQGFAVLSWWLNRHHAGCLLRFLVLFLAVDLEASFLIVSLLGLVDFWANFRHLARGDAEPPSQKQQ